MLIAVLSRDEAPSWNAEPAAGPTDAAHGHLSCAQCHRGIPAQAPAQARAQDQDGAGSTTLRAGEARLCAECHPGAIEASHPIGFVPDHRLPAAFPLAADGTMTCSTCHDVHGTTPRLVRLGENRDPSDTSSLCLSCHDAAFFEAMPDGGESLHMSGHLDASGIPWSSIDPYSVQCMTCHAERAPTPGGQFAMAAQIASAAPNNWFGGPSDNHPIGADYTEAVRFGDFRPQAVLADEILLPKGHVGCVSCHVPYTREHGRKPRTTSGLCLECHAL